MEPTTPDPDQLIAWHPAFIEALQVELEEYEDALEFHPEDPLTSGTLKIDCVVIKKTKGTVIRKNIAAVFREWNHIRKSGMNEPSGIAAESCSA